MLTCDKQEIHMSSKKCEESDYGHDLDIFTLIQGDVRVPLGKKTKLAFKTHIYLP